MRWALHSLKWLYPGMRVKRWLGLSFLGLFVSLMGVSLAFRNRPLDLLAIPNNIWDGLAYLLHFSHAQWPNTILIGWIIILSGLGICAFALARLTHSLATAANPGDNKASLVDVVYRNRFLSQGARVVVIGGGTGLSTMLRGLKQYTNNITAVVTVTDDGGSSGKLTRQLNMLPPGDIRNCLVALADSEADMTDLFQYRFKGGSTFAGEGLRDHAFGNLLIAAMNDIAGGDFQKAIKQTSTILNIRGRVLPSTLQHCGLRAEMANGEIIEGETAIVHSPNRIKRIMLTPPEAKPIDEVIGAIAEADLIVLGPGSVYTSVLPPLLVQGIPEALRQSRAKKIYICNVMTQKGETDNFTASDHIKAIEGHVPTRIFDYVLANTGRPSDDLLEKYASAGSVLVEPDADRLKALSYRVVTGDFISQTDVVRHNPAALAEAIMRLLR
ncbi:MAG: YvcK family protein [Chthonomonadales bacterium]